MVDLTFILHGDERISGNDLEQRSMDPLDRTILLAQRNHIQRRLDRLSCSEHGQGAHVTAAGPSADRLTISVDGCCQRFVDKTRATLEADTPELAWPAGQVTPPEPSAAVPRPSGGEGGQRGDLVTAMAGTAAVAGELSGLGGLSDDEELALEAVRRQLDIDFPRVQMGGNADREGEGSAEAQPKKRPPSRARRVGIVASTLVLVGLAGGAAGVYTATMRVRGGDLPVRIDPAPVADREAPPPRPEMVRTRARVPARTRSASSPQVRGPWANDGKPTGTAPLAPVQAP